MSFEQILDLMKSAVIPLSAVVVSILVWLHSKRVIYASIFSAGRLEWIRELRSKIGEFATLLLRENPDKNLLLLKKFEIESYLNYTRRYPDYLKLRDVLDAYVHTPQNDLTELLTVSQQVLGNCYDRAKFEAGLTKRKEQKAQQRNYGKSYIISRTSGSEPSLPETEVPQPTESASS